MHLQWQDREKNQVVTDLIVINDAYLEKIDKCTTGRAFVLRYTSHDKKVFFWMQEPNADNDAELVKKFNDVIGATIPAKKGTAGAATAAPATAPAPAAAQPDYD